MGSKYGRDRQRRARRSEAEPVARTRYEPPKGAEETTYPIQLTDEHRLTVRLATYRKLVVDFAIMQQYWGPAEFPAEVHRTDCCHGEVHHHQMYASGRPEDRFVVEIIPPENGWQTVDKQYRRCHDQAFDEHLARYQTWEAS